MIDLGFRWNLSGRTDWLMKRYMSEINIRFDSWIKKHSDLLRWCQEREGDPFVGDNSGVLGDNKHHKDESIKVNSALLPTSQQQHKQTWYQLRAAIGPFCPVADQKKSGVLHFVLGTETQYARRTKRLNPCYMGVAENWEYLVKRRKDMGRGNSCLRVSEGLARRKCSLLVLCTPQGQK